MKKRSKRYNEILKTAIKDKKIAAKEIIDLVKKNSTTKFDESIDVSLRINLKQSKGGDLSLRTVVNLPNGSGKKSKVAVLCETDKIDDAKKSGAEIVGSDDLIEKIAAGKFDFTKLICTPAMMSKIGKHGKVLGPKGLMPNPKLGSVSENIKEAVTNAKSGQVEIRNDKDGNIGVSIGKKSFNDDKLLKNYHAILEALDKEKSNNTLKGDLIKNSFATSTMGVSYKVKLEKAI
jgi:large subunit ribosomal protein L1